MSLPKRDIISTSLSAQGAAMMLPDFLHNNEFGEIFLTGHRITLYHIVADYNDGHSAEMIAAEYPTLSLAQVHKVIAFYLENATEVDAYVAQTGEELDRQEAAGSRVDLAKLRARLAQRRKAETSRSTVTE